MFKSGTHLKAKQKKKGGEQEAAPSSLQPFPQSVGNACEWRGATEMIARRTQTGGAVRQPSFLVWEVDFPP